MRSCLPFRLRGVLGTACLVLLAILPRPSRAEAGAADSLELRLGRIRGIVGDLQRELDTLEGAVRGRSLPARDSW